jgi:hypothetical protein
MGAGSSQRVTHEVSLPPQYESNTSSTKPSIVHTLITTPMCPTVDDNHGNSSGCSGSSSSDNGAKNENPMKRYNTHKLHSLSNNKTNENERKLSRFPAFLKELETDESIMIACYNSSKQIEYLSDGVYNAMGFDMNSPLEELSFGIAPIRGAIFYRQDIDGSLIQFHNTYMSRLASGEVFTIDEKLSGVGKDRLAILISKEGIVQLCDGGSESGVQSSFASDIMGKNLIAMTASEDANLFSDAMMIASHGVCSYNLTTKLSCHGSRVEMDFFPSSNNFTVVLLSAQPDSLSSHFVADVQQSEPGSLCSNEVFALNRKLHDLNTEIRYLKDFRDSTMLPMYSVGPNSTICWANNAMLDMMGYGDARHEYIGSNANLYHVDQSLFNTMLTNVFDGETLNDITCNLRRRDGDVINVTYNSNAKFDSDGNFCTLDALCRI